MTIQATMADVLSVHHGLGQVVGGWTTSINILKMFFDLVDAVTSRTWKGDEKFHAKMGEERVQHLSDKEKLAEIDQKILSLPGHRFERHMMFAQIGGIRATPFLGMAYSIARCADVIHLEQKPDNNFCSLRANVKGVTR